MISLNLECSFASKGKGMLQINKPGIRIKVNVKTMAFVFSHFTPFAASLGLVLLWTKALNLKHEESDHFAVHVEAVAKCIKSRE